MPRSLLTDLVSRESLARLTVRDCMSPNPTTIDTHATAGDALKLMERHGIRHLPVVNEGRLVALISERHLHDAAPSILTMPEAQARQRVLAATPILQVAVPHPATIPAEANLRHAIARMRRLRAGSLPVMAEGRLVGILTGGDLLSVLDGLLREAGVAE